jgi:hypothetical protein
VADLAWPRHIVDQPLFNGFGITMLPAVQQMDVEAGPPRQWQVHASDYRTADVRFFFLNEAKRRAFDLWYHRTLRNGTLPFDVQLKDGRSVNWWEAMFRDVWEVEFIPPGMVRMGARLLLIGAPFAARTAPAIAATFDSVLQMRAVPSATFALRATFDARLELRAAPLDDTPLGATFDARLELNATAALNLAEALAATFDARLELRAVLTSSAPRLTEDSDERVTEDGEERWVD